MEKGNIVAEYQINGVRVFISDSAYTGKSDAELEAVRRDARRIAWNIALRYEARKRCKECTYEEVQEAL